MIGCLSGLRSSLGVSRTVVIRPILLPCLRLKLPEIIWQKELHGLSHDLARRVVRDAQEGAFRYLESLRIGAADSSSQNPLRLRGKDPLVPPPTCLADSCMDGGIS